jgi:hypothetical protein
MRSSQTLRVLGWAAVLGAVGLVLALITVVLLMSLIDPDRSARDLAMRDVRSRAQLDYGQVWDDLSPCFQRRNPKADWVRSQGIGQFVQPVKAPADTTYSLVSLMHDGVYDRIDVRVTEPGIPSMDVEIDVRQYGGRWVVVDAGALGHEIRDACA